MTLIIYDNTGFVLGIRGGETEREPQGVPFLWVEIPQGKRIKTSDGFGVDVTVTPNVAVLEDIPPTEEEILKVRINAVEDTLMLLI